MRKRASLILLVIVLAVIAAVFFTLDLDRHFTPGIL